MGETRVQIYHYSFCCPTYIIYSEMIDLHPDFESITQFLFGTCPIHLHRSLSKDNYKKNSPIYWNFHRSLSKDNYKKNSPIYWNLRHSLRYVVSIYQPILFPSNLICSLISYPDLSIWSLIFVRKKCWHIC